MFSSPMFVDLILERFHVLSRATAYEVMVADAKSWWEYVPKQWQTHISIQCIMFRLFRYIFVQYCTLVIYLIGTKALMHMSSSYLLMLSAIQKYIDNMPQLHVGVWPMKAARPKYALTHRVSFRKL